MFQRILNFIKYHNAFTIILGLVFLISASVLAADEDIRNAVIGEKTVIEQGTDNSQLLSADLDNFNINLKINNVLEDEKNYYIDYSFNTISVQDNVWQQVIKLEKFTVNKVGLGNRDLGVYLAGELGEVANSEISRLKNSQKAEKERGATKIVKTTNYSGLIGITLDLKNKILPGYEPVVTPLVIDIVQQVIVEPEPEPELEPEPDVCDADNLNLCTNQADCEAVAGYWYSDTCNLEAEANDQPPVLVCDADNLDLCITQELCEGDGLYWYSDTCNLEAEIPACVPIDEICNGIDDDCDSDIDEDCNCGITSCAVSLNLVGDDCQNTCLGVDGCGTCTPTCSCAEGYQDVEGSCQLIEPEPEE